jgi:hypothetical protein
MRSTHSHHHPFFSYSSMAPNISIMFLIALLLLIFVFLFMMISAEPGYAQSSCRLPQASSNHAAVRFASRLLPFRNNSHRSASQITGKCSENSTERVV